MKIKSINYEQQVFLEFMLWFVKVYEPEVYVEIGIGKYGYTFGNIAPLVKKAVGVDIRRFPYPELPHVKAMVMPSLEAVKMWDEKILIDLLFIDADHHKEAVLEDFKAWGRFVTEGTGFIFLHDTHPVMEKLFAPGECNNAWEAAWEIRNDPILKEMFELVTFPGPWAGMSIIRKSKTQLCWRRG